jgi:hypothetical protein
VDDINTNGRCLLTAFRIRRRFMTTLPIQKQHMYIVGKITPAVEKLRNKHTCYKTRDTVTRHTCCLHGSQISTERQLPCKPESGHVVLVHIVHFDLCGRSTGGQMVGYIGHKALNYLKNKTNRNKLCCQNRYYISPTVFQTMHEFFY